MKILKRSRAAKLIALILMCIMALVFTGSVYGISELVDADAYRYSYDHMVRNKMEQMAYSYARTAVEDYRNGEDSGFDRTNFRYEIFSPDGEKLEGTYEGEDTLATVTERAVPYYNVTLQDVPVPVVTPTPTPVLQTPEPEPMEEIIEPAEEDGEEPEVTPTPRPAVTPTPISGVMPTMGPSLIPSDVQSTTQYRVWAAGNSEPIIFTSEEALDAWVNENTLTVKGYVLADMEQEDAFSLRLQEITRLYGLRIPLLVTAAVSLVIGLLLFVFLIAAAGYRKGAEKAAETWVEHIPYDVFAVVCIAVFCLAMVLAAWMFLDQMDQLPGVMGCGVGVLGMLLTLTLFSMSTAVRIRCGTLRGSSLIGRMFRWVGSRGRGLSRTFRTVPLLRRWAAVIAAVLLVEFFLVANGLGTFMWLINAIVLTPAILWMLWGLQRVRKGTQELAAGNLNYTVDTGHLPPELKEQAEDLNRIRGGMNTAVEERLKSERFRTELITNVSHDIKTPLTSIINYVDLMEKEEPESETMREYLDVLSRQSLKLKKLIEDLIEASKAAAGSLPVDAQRCELQVLVDQMAGEYAERLKAADLKLIVSQAKEPLCILADGRHMWRIFDNLLGNICKYAMPGTRVYLTTEKQGADAWVHLRNISREPLTMSAEELTERFARGDSARTTEGSGLGLSIADSLSKLQGGEMILAPDGDLFKVSLRFPLIPAEKAD
ncbi:MAG: hypothetical protein IJK03_05935 [Oscillospiraceae bacterium]|nr:hypothetical protein [Oscillospiraceae bacterium]